MKVVIALEFEITDPEDILAAVTAIDPPRLPGFARQMWVCPDPGASVLIQWLQEGSESPLPD